MSQVTQPRISLLGTALSRRSLWMAALLALAAGIAVMLVLTLPNDAPESSATSGVAAQPSLRSDGGPEESRVAASVASGPAARPDEARIAASITPTTRPSSGPDESRTAAALGKNTSTRSGGPDESRTAASLSDR